MGRGQKNGPRGRESVSGGAERKMEGLTFIENLLCASDYETLSNGKLMVM